MHCMWFLKSLNNFLPREENRHTALPFVCKVIANPLLLPGSLHWPQEQKAFLMKCTALPFCGMPSKQKHFLCLTPGLGLLGNRSFLTTPPACQHHLFGEAGSTLLSHGKSRSGIFFFFFTCQCFCGARFCFLFLVNIHLTLLSNVFSCNHLKGFIQTSICFQFFSLLHHLKGTHLLT